MNCHSSHLKSNSLNRLIKDPVGIFTSFYRLNIGESKNKDSKH